MLALRFKYSLAALLAGIALVILTACGSSGSDSTVAADFTINGVKGSISGQNVTIDLRSKEACTNVTAMVAGIQASGYTVSPDPSVARDYSQAVQYTLTAADGTKTVYSVTVLGNGACQTTTTATPVTPVIPVTPVTPVTPTVVACTADAIGSTGYSLVFKGCDSANVATYYAKDECVRDNATGLIWQGQTAAGTGLRANDAYKTNFDSTTGLQNNNGGYPIDATQAQIDASTNSIGFKNVINASKLCGSGAWRMPTQIELKAIRKAGVPSIDNEWFPNTNAGSGIYYWTSEHYNYGDATDRYAVIVAFSQGAYEGYFFGGSRDGLPTNGLVRLVR